MLEDTDSQVLSIFKCLEENGRGRFRALEMAGEKHLSFKLENEKLKIQAWSVREPQTLVGPRKTPGFL